MDNWAFWILVFPMLVIAILYYLGFLTVGLSFVFSAFKSRNLVGKFILLVTGIGVISLPLLAIKFQDHQADRKADKRQEYLANLEKVSLNSRLPRKFVTVGRFSKPDIDFIKRQYRIGQYTQTETDRLARAYRLYRKAQFCHTHSSGKTLPGTQLTICRDLPDSIQAALQIKEPILFFAEGSNTSLRTSNKIVGNMYEVRLVTRSDDLLVAYYEDRTLERPAGITNPFSSSLKRDPDAERLSKRDFIQNAFKTANHRLAK
ncbi:hypothetical protein [Fretibacter rubidus]|uniref:hypothetical protein n=1 Tax=Fretibacter rubidus TaxID=570162 RepID=UPI00352B6ED1